MNKECSNLDILITTNPKVCSPNDQPSYDQQRELSDAYQKTLSSISLWCKRILPENISISGNNSSAYSDLIEVIRACKKNWNDSELLLILNSDDFSDDLLLPELLEETGCKLEIQIGEDLQENYEEIELLEKIVRRWERTYYINVVFSNEQPHLNNSNSFFTKISRCFKQNKALNIDTNLKYSYLQMRNGNVYYANLNHSRKTARNLRETQDGTLASDLNNGFTKKFQKYFSFRQKSSPKKIKIGFCLPTMAMGGVTRSLLTMMNASCAHDLEWSGFAIGNALAFDPETAHLILEHCPIYSSIDHPDFKGLVTIVGNACQTIVDQSDVVNLWGYTVPNRELETTNWKKKPMLIVAHGQNEWTSKNIQTSLRYAEQSILASVSQCSIQSFPEHLRKNVKAIYNGIDFNRCTSLLSRDEIRKSWGIGSDTIAIGYIGRFTNGKNIFAAAQAVSVLGKNYHAVYVGEGLGNDHVTNRVKELCGKHCSFMPRTEDIGSVLSGLDCLISASPSEGGPLTVSEAWVAGCPVVSTPVGFVPELEEKYGQLVFSLPHDPTPDQLAIEVKKTIKPGVIVQRAREVAIKEFDAKQMVKGYESLISGKLNDKRVEIHNNTDYTLLNDTGIVFDARSHSAPKISVVMPVYNSEKYIGESLESIRNQSFQDYELIIVHDGSTDDTLTIMLAHLEQLGFENLLLVNQSNGGTGAALNEGFRHVRGEYSTWWTADSFMEEVCLETLLTTIESSDVDFVYGDYSILYEESGVTQFVEVPEYDFKRLQNDCFVGVCWLWKHSLKKMAGEFQIAVCEDFDMHLRMAELGKFQRSPGQLGTWRNHSENVSNRICIPKINHLKEWRKAIDEKEIRLGICMPNMAMGGVTRLFLTMMNASIGHSLEWSGIAIGDAKVFDLQTAQSILRHCPIYCTVDDPKFQGLVTIVPNACQAIVDQSDLINLWGYNQSNAEIDAAEWESIPMLIISHGQCDWTRQNLSVTFSKSKMQIIVAVSAAAGEMIEEITDKSYQVIYNAVDFSRCAPVVDRETTRKAWGIEPGAKAIGYIGRFAYDKNPLATAKAVSELGEDYHAVYVGEGWQSDEVIAEAKELCGNRLTVVSRAEDVGTILSALDCVVTAAANEGGPLVAAEAWLAGCPVVSTPAGMIPELEQKYGPLVYGIPFEPSEPELVNAVLDAIVGDDRIERAKSVAWNLFSPGKLIAQYEDAVRGVR